MSRRRTRWLARKEALRILARIREGYDDDGMSAALVVWCLEQTGDI